MIVSVQFKGMEQLWKCNSNSNQSQETLKSLAKPADANEVVHRRCSNSKSQLCLF
jgi:hypothetical protein